MESLIVIALIVFLVIVIIVIFNSNKSEASKTATPESKKEQIKETYKQQLDELYKCYGHDPILLKHKKLEVIKVINSELSRNIYFNQDEARTLLKELIAYSTLVDKE